LKSGLRPGWTCSTREGTDAARRRAGAAAAEAAWVRVDKAYRFETDEGSVSLADLFGGRSQLLVYHFMFGPGYKAGVRLCSAIADGFDGFVVHLANHDVTLSAVSRAPLAKAAGVQAADGWRFPWASSLGSDFNFDFKVSFTEEQQRSRTIAYNYRKTAIGSRAKEIAAIEAVIDVATEGPRTEIAASVGTDWRRTRGRLPA